jgi:hypothetical protein
MHKNIFKEHHGQMLNGLVDNYSAPCMCVTEILELSIFLILFREDCLQSSKVEIKIIIKHIGCRTRFATRPTGTYAVLSALSGMTHNPSESACEVTTFEAAFM